MIPPPLITWFLTIGEGRLEQVEVRSLVPVVPASFSVWQPPHFVMKICFPFVPVIGLRLDEALFTPTLAATYAATSIAFCPVTRLAGMFALRKSGSFCRDRVLARELDLVVDDVQDRRLLEPFGARLRERGVEVRADRRRVDPAAASV